jgi:hypothetical protein
MLLLPIEEEAPIIRQYESTGIIIFYSLDSTIWIPRQNALFVGGFTTTL